METSVPPAHGFPMLTGCLWAVPAALPGDLPRAAGVGKGLLVRLEVGSLVWTTHPAGPGTFSGCRKEGALRLIVAFSPLGDPTWSLRELDKCPNEPAY